MKELKVQNMELLKKVSWSETKTAELERYKRRRNLRLNGLKEENGENTWRVVADIILKIAPHWKEKMDIILDSVHRLGPVNNSRPRQIILQFTSRRFRDEIWKTTKLHKICKDLKIRFAEDLTKEDREAWMVGWPKVEKARKDGMKTMFRGPHAFINGQKVLPWICKWVKSLKTWVKFNSNYC